MVYIIGNHHVYTHIIPPRRHSSSHQPSIQTLAHISSILEAVATPPARKEQPRCLRLFREAFAPWASARSATGHPGLFQNIATSSTTAWRSNSESPTWLRFCKQLKRPAFYKLLGSGHSLSHTSLLTSATLCSFVVSFALTKTTGTSVDFGLDLSPTYRRHGRVQLHCLKSQTSSK